MRSAALLLCLVAGPVQANTVDCGGNSFSYAEVVRAPRAVVSKDGAARAEPRSGVVQVVPHSLCADLIEHRRDPFGPGGISIELPQEPRRP